MAGIGEIAQSGLVLRDEFALTTPSGYFTWKPCLWKSRKSASAPWCCRG
jgi:hypothetical protein